MRATLLCYIFCAVLFSVYCTVDYDKAEKFLEKYEGFKIPKVSNNEIQNHISLLPSFIHAMKKFQKYAGLPITGKLDEAGMEMMKKPRCGNSDEDDNNDINDTGKTRKHKRYATASKWRKKRLTYHILPNQYPDDKLTKQQVDNTIDKAFRYWSDVSDLTFERVSSRYSADIIMLFAKRDHGDGNDFDGPGRVLAHAYFPSNGDVHFDDDESFTVRSYDGTDLEQIATHEIGHSIGLKHSDVRGAVMYPYYTGYQPNFALQDDDIQGVRSLYGFSGSARSTAKTTVKPVIPSVVPTVNSYPNLCSLSSIDTFVESLDGYLYVFKGAYCWKMNKYGDLQSRIPQKISDAFPGLPNDIDAGFMWKTKSTYFFKGGLYWRYRGSVMQRGFPKRIGIDGFRGVPRDLSTAFIYKGNSVIYFTKGNLYYRYENFRTRSGYPKFFDRIWKGLPENVDAAVGFSESYTKYNFFFKGNKYYRFNSDTFSVDKGYPRNTGPWWFRCYNNIQDGSIAAEIKETGSASERETENNKQEPNNQKLIEGNEEIDDSFSKASATHFSILSLTSLLLLKFIF